VHLNPVFVKSVRSRPIRERTSLLRQYRWSSYRSYIGSSSRLPFVDHGPILAMIQANPPGQAGGYRRFVEAGISDIDAAFIEVKTASRLCIGSEDFRNRVHTLYENLLHKKARPEDVAFRRLGRRLPVEVILDIVCRELESPRDRLLSRQRDCLPRAVAARMLCDWGALTQREVASVLGLGSGAAVSAQLRRLAQVLAANCNLRKHMANIAATLAGRQSANA